MKKAVRLLLSLSLCAAFALSMTACGGRINRESKIEREEFTVQFNLPANTKTSISVLRPDNEYETKMMQAAIDGFHEKYPLIDVNIKTVTISGTSASYNETVIKQHKAGNLADIIWTDSAKYYFLVSNGIALNLEPFYEQADAAGVFTDKEGKALKFADAFTTDYRSMAKYGELSYAVPRSTDSVVTFYNKDILKAAGVDLDPATTKVKNGWSWDDFTEVCGQVRTYFDTSKPDNYYPLDANLNWESLAWPVVKSFGGEVIDKDGKFSLGEDVNKSVYGLVQGLTSAKFVHTKNDSASNFETGTGAFLFQSASIDKYQHMQGTRDKFDVVSFPLINGENSAIGYGFAGYSLNRAVLKNQDRLNAACAFLAYLMSYEGQQKLAKDGGLALPSIRTDLSMANPDAEWHKTYGTDFNLEAYTYGSQYKTELDFLRNVPPVHSLGIVAALNSYVGKYAKEETEANALRYFQKDVEYEFKKVV